MSVIGSFTLAKDGSWSGSIHTLAIDAKTRFVPNDNRAHDSAPTFRVMVGESRIGDAWEARSGGEPPKNCPRVRFDDPGLLEPISAALFPSEDGGTAQLVWNRRRPADSWVTAEGAIIMDQEKRPEDEATNPANDNGADANKPFDPRILRIAQAIGRQLARDHIRRWQAADGANDNDASGRNDPPKP
jgi:uncharacterized protein (DUF736 family)